MKVGIIHLSDIHVEKDSYESQIDLIIKSLSYNLKELSNVYIVISGDVVQKGKPEEFELAKSFINKLKRSICNFNSIMKVKFVSVPGNHDCCFDNVKATRRYLLNACRVDELDEEDFFNEALEVQNNYWKFYEDMNNEVPEDKVSYTLEFRPHIEHKIKFHCYNTSWLSEISEKPGSLVIPQNKFLEANSNEFVIAVFHHPISWLSPNTDKNNKARFEEHILKSSNMVLYGHEHDTGRTKNISIKGDNTIFCGAKAFHQRRINETGFAFYEIDFEKNIIGVLVYKYNKDGYKEDFKDNYSITKKVRRVFSIKEQFEKKINTLNIPLKHSKKEKLYLSDVFIYPDLEPLDDKQDVVQYPNSKELIDSIEKNDNLNVLIEGDDQAGKTTLLYFMFRKLYDLRYNPIYIKGSKVNITDVKKIVKKAVKNQYSKNDVTQFLKLDRKVLMLDNFHKSPLNTKYKKILINNLKKHFDYIVITADSSIGSDVAAEETTNLHLFDKYKLLPLGHEKRGELIEQWLRIGQNELTINEEILIKDIQIRFDEINSLLGNKLMPSYPIFILTLLQGLDASVITQDFSQTSYAHVYNALITASLIREDVKDGTAITSYLNILKELAFYLFDSNKSTFSDVDFQSFYTSYEERYYRDASSDQVLSKLQKANIIRYEDGLYCFSYKYIYFYLVAQKISSKIGDYQDLIERLCEGIHLEKNANILIFLSHHSKAQLLINNIVFISQIPFEFSKPISLDKDDNFVQFISDFAEEIRNDIIEDRDPKKVIKSDLKKRDEIDRKNQRKKTSDLNDDMSKEAIDIHQAFRAIKIIGQIVKNQKGDFEKKKLIELVESAYNTSFRLIGFISDTLVNEKEDLIETVAEGIDASQELSKGQIEKSVRKFIQFISWRICIEVFNNLMFSVGARSRNELYDTVEKRMGTTASKIVTFAIKSYYGSINTHELKQLFKETEHNYLAQSILRVYVKKHLYTNIIDRAKKERIIQIAGFRPQSVVKVVDVN